jgi:hypothetical protein
VFAAVCVLLAALGHALMSGAGVPAGALAAGWAVTTAAGWCLAGRERGAPLIVTVVVAAQTALHQAFSYAQAPPGHDMGPMHLHSPHPVPATPPMSPMSPMPMDAMDMGTTAMSPAPSTFSSGAGMLAAHLLAAVLTGLWLAYGEKAAFRILRAAAGRLAAPLRLLLALPPARKDVRAPARRDDTDRAPSLLLVHAITSRGPPEGTAVA